MKRTSEATTRTAHSAHAPTDRGRHLNADEIIKSPETGLHYRIERFLGEGGFGQVYLASAPRAIDATCPQTVCIKVSPHIDGWLREAYFGQLLDDHPRAIRVFDVFPLVRDAGPAASSTASRSSTRATAT